MPGDVQELPRGKPGRGTTFVNVQALRALAAMLVVMFHMGDLTTALGMAPARFSFAALGVDLFFVISGFIMVYTTDLAPTSATRFILNRIARIAPLYWLVTLAVFVIAFAAPDLMRRADGSVSGLIRSLLFIPYPRLDGRMEPVLFLGWSLNYEMFFYVLFAGALYLGRGRSQIGLAVGAILTLAIIGQVTNLPPRSTAAFYCNIKIVEFAAGMVIARWLPRLSMRRWATVFGFCVGFGWLIVTPLLFVGAAATLNVCGACSLMLVSALGAERAGLAIRTPAVILLGDASYALYLVHPFAGQAVVKVWRMTGAGVPAAAVAFVAAIIASACLAILVHLCVEKPLSAMARRLLGTKRQAVPARGL